MAKEKKRFYPVRQFRLSEENYEKLQEFKLRNKGTWNFLITKMNIIYEPESLKKVLGELSEDRNKKRRPRRK